MFYLYHCPSDFCSSSLLLPRNDEVRWIFDKIKHQKALQICGMKYSYVLGTIWYNCRQGSDFFQYIQFFVIYDYLWAFCKTNYMKRYKITANKMLLNFEFLTILGYETPGLLQGIDFGHFVDQHHHCRGRWSWLGDVHFIWWLKIKI